MATRKYGANRVPVKKTVRAVSKVKAKVRKC